MKCYLINLDRATERLARMQRLLDSHGLHYERVAAVDARTKNYKLAPAHTKTPAGQPALVSGDIGCGASHRLCLQLIAEGDDPYAVVLEDDVHLASDISFYLKSDSWIPADADLVKLETFHQITFLLKPVSTLPNNRSVARLVRGHWGAAAYVVSREAARRIVREFDNEVEYVDVFLFEARLADYKTYQVNPALVVQHSMSSFPHVAFLESGTHPERHPVSIVKLKGWPKFWRETRRVWRQVSEPVQILWFKAGRGRHYGRVPYQG